MSDIWFWSEAKRSAKKSMEHPAMPISIYSLQRKLGSTVCQQLLVVHASGGCDTTSASLAMEKVKYFRGLLVMKPV